MGLCTATFESGTNGNSPSTGDPGSATPFDIVTIQANAQLTYSNTHPAHGGLGLKVVSTGTPGSNISDFEWTSGSFGTNTDHYGRFYVYQEAVTAGDTFLVWERESISAGGALRFNGAANKLALLDDAFATVATSTNALPLGTQNRIEYHVIHSATVGQIEAKLFLGANSEGTVPDETIATTATLNLGINANLFRIGLLSNDANITYWFDDIVAGATSYPGPVAEAGPPPSPPISALGALGL